MNRFSAVQYILYRKEVYVLKIYIHSNATFRMGKELCASTIRIHSNIIFHQEENNVCNYGHFATKLPTYKRLNDKIPETFRFNGNSH